MNLDVSYLADADVDSDMDRQLRKLLTTCFTGPQDHVFEQQRYFSDPYPHRWMIRNPHGVIVAHTGVHEKELRVNGTAYRTGGVADVCVHPDCRGRGYVRIILSSVHEWLASNGFAFAVLFGDTAVYRSSGYVPVANLFDASVQSREDAVEPLHFSQARPLTEAPWPATAVFIKGVPF